jgi:hypothetical protein
LFISSIEPQSAPISFAKDVTSLPAATPAFIAPKAAIAVLIGSITLASINFSFSQGLLFSSGLETY